jgi:hypothetical protein
MMRVGAVALLERAGELDNALVVVTSDHGKPFPPGQGDSLRFWNALHRLAFGKRPAEELYDLSHDPEQLENVAALSEYQQVKLSLAQRLEQFTRQTSAPRALGLDAPWDHYPYFGIRINKDWTVTPKKGNTP